MSNLALKIAVRQPLVWGGIPRSEGGTVPDVATTYQNSDPIYVGDSETLSAEFAVSNVSGATHVIASHQISFDYNPKTKSGTWVDETTIVADMTTDDTMMPYALSVILAPYIRLRFGGAASNGSFNRIRGSLTKQ